MTVLEERAALDESDTAEPDTGEPDTAALDAIFRRIEEEIHVPAGYRAQVVGGNIVMSPQRAVHSLLIFAVRDAVLDCLGRQVRVLSDVRVDMPGLLNAFAPDVICMRDDLQGLPGGAIRYQDIRFVAEVVSASSASDDYGRKQVAYAAAGIPLYMIIDPRKGQVHLRTDPHPADSEGSARYGTSHAHAFGERFELPGLGIVVDTGDWPRD